MIRIAQLINRTEVPYLFPSSWSPDGRWLAFHGLHPENLRDIYVVQVDSAENPIPVAVTSANERGAQFSPNGRWLAYTSDETSSDEVYVVSFPEIRGKRQVSAGGGTRPQWSATSDELFFQKGGTLMAAKVSTEGLFRWETPRPLFESRESYQVAPDGQRFLVKVQNPDAPAAEIHVVVNWFEELKRLAPTD